MSAAQALRDTLRFLPSGARFRPSHPAAPIPTSPPPPAPLPAGFWRRTVAFAGILLAIHLALCLVFALTIGREHDVRNMDARWLAGPRPVNVMIAGDSHARFAVEGPVLGAAINVAVPGEHYLKTMYRVPWLLDHGSRRVGAIVLPYDAISFATFKADSYSPELVWGRYIDWFDLGRRKQQRFSFFGKWLKARFAPYVGEFETMEQYLTASKHFRDPTGGGPSPLALQVAEDGTMVAQRHLRGAQPWDPVMEDGFRTLVADILQRGIRIVLVRFPVTRDYAVELRRLGADPSKREALFAEIGRPGVVDQLDYEKLFFGKPEMFADGDHLNPIGKRELSIALARDLYAMGILPTPPTDKPLVPGR